MDYGLKIYCDGGARGNPGPAASAFVVESKGRTIYKGSKFLGNATNNVAEYNAVILALEWVLKIYGRQSTVDSLRFILDSELVAKQLSGSFKIKNENLKILFCKVKNLEEKLDKKIYYTNVERSKNKLADFLVNKTLDENS